jgi:hypothetical protein
MTEPVNPNPLDDEPAGRDLAGTISAIAGELSERVTVLVDKATPVVRDAAARASELVAKVGEAAGPAAHRAAGATADLGEKVAAKGRDWATDLRRSNQAAGWPAEGTPADGTPVAGQPVAGAAGPTAEPSAAQALPGEPGVPAPTDAATDPASTDHSAGG